MVRRVTESPRGVPGVRLNYEANSGVSFFKIYKKEQGRAVRIGTAVGVAIMTLLAIHWTLHRIIPTEPKYIQAIVSIVIAGAGVLLAFAVVNRPKNADFMILTESEMRKVVWPTPAGVVRSTRLVILMTLGLAAMLWLVDSGFVWLFQKIHILR